ncbi:MAG: hypothetical protein JHC26_08865 [Thermofilum sp.]|jgi:hypothetical protein|uniref:hypothetical protein n=1 Tax=Thermofilum sp. TaxID=1961369 RepID=UPI002589095A|nr:hypothetical protein [Thermofilum sp.]MCI4409189.1 hypothetical protein [Thermofilum sp.]
MTEARLSEEKQYIYVVQYVVLKTLTKSENEVYTVIDILDGETIREASIKRGVPAKKVKRVLQLFMKHIDLDHFPIRTVINKTVEYIDKKYPQRDPVVCVLCAKPQPPGTLSRHIYEQHTEELKEIIREVAKKTLFMDLGEFRLINYGGLWRVDNEEIQLFEKIIEQVLKDQLATYYSHYAILKYSRIANKMRTEDKYIKKQTLEISQHRLINIIRNYAESITTIVDSNDHVWRKQSADERQIVFERSDGQKQIDAYF